MGEVIVGMFASYRDGHDALRALQAAGLKRDDAQLYRTAATAIGCDALVPPAHDEDDAEYIAHGEHQGVMGTRNRFIAGDMPSVRAASRERTLLIIKFSDELKPRAIGDVLHDHGAVAIRDATGHWRLSPFRNSARIRTMAANA
ncbi:hypothetical protein BVER_01009 [Candidatus Burkholderia verschuerenii]|uniref:Uncharacterized protein n=2 Tax=Candidatus Burkholderia verschuerenii TaxID=242163 RepID=A0A0L0MDM0_9BURK|nr:hypothetical protein BVER_01009 [Candidatus Burkholderia verschuerenii]